jgi:hypothetical protein
MKTDITLYLDMDGVLANFSKVYYSMKTGASDGNRFRAAVMQFKIFEDLEFMPDTQQLLNHVSRLSGIKVEILTSLGTFDTTQGNEAKHQKLKWLQKHNIPYRANFVRSKKEKADYASQDSILIDDSIGCISPFIQAGGQGILHTSASDTIRVLDSTIANLRALRALHS